MGGFNFEKDLKHQDYAIKAVLSTFSGVQSIELDDKTVSSFSNPIVSLSPSLLSSNLDRVQERNDIDKKLRNIESNVLDISMETGTGKTYTYAKMMFELHKNLNLGKFIIVVPTLSIKAGTLSFLEAKSTREHFSAQYQCDIKTYLVESKKGKQKKETMPIAVKNFVEARRDSKTIHILVINSGMLNSPTMSKNFDTALFDRFSSPFEAISSISPITIVDEPHRFKKKSTENDKTSTSWKNIEKFTSQYVFRYGATFNEQYENLIYNLTAVDAFNQDLVKGVITYIEDFSEKQNALVTLSKIDGNEAVFILNIDGKVTTHKLKEKDSMSIIHKEMHDLNIDKLNTKVVLLSNGLEIKKGAKINPFSYSHSIQDKMIENTIKKHFEIERELLTKDVKIKPLTLFFIDDITGYRDGSNIAGSLKTKFEALLKSYIEKELETQEHPFYVEYLKKSLRDLSLTHGGYFSKDNSEKDDKIEQEINEILHDKETLLSLDNTRRFIFSKWTLREGWDNPNVFQICKLRSSGSITSKLQEVGRGLRLPVNEYMARVKDVQFDLHYYVDFDEKDFAEQLVNEINEKSKSVWIDNPVKLTNAMIDNIIKIYQLSEDELLEKLDDAGVIKRNNDFKDGGYDKLKELYPKVLADGLKKGKVKSGNEKSVKATLRQGKYAELKDLWETINQKVILEYKIENEEKFEELLTKYFEQSVEKFKPQGIITHTKKIEVKNNVASYVDLESLNNEFLPITTMSYREFLIKLATAISVNINTLHNVFIKIKVMLNINEYRNIQTVRIIKSGFNKFLLDNAISEYSIGYSKVQSSIHPTKFTKADGTPEDSIDISQLGVFYSEERVSDDYMFEELYYDSELEKEDIKKNIAEVIVFTKIPKSSITIPVAGGGTYSPDFAYIIKDKEGNKSLGLVVEAKGKEERALYKEEDQKIKHAEALFDNKEIGFKVVFKTQFSDVDMKDILSEYINQR